MRKYQASIHFELHFENGFMGPAPPFSRNRAHLPNDTFAILEIRISCERGVFTSKSVELAQVIARFHARDVLELLDTTTRNFLPLPTRASWGEGWGEGHSINVASSPQPSSCGEERENISSGQAVVVSRCDPAVILSPTLRSQHLRDRW